MRPQGYLKLVFREAIVEEQPALPFFLQKSVLDMRRLRLLLQSAARHRRVEGVLLIIKDVSAKWAQIEEIHRDLALLHRAGKRSVAYLEQADNLSFYLACGAQRVFLSPAANLDLIGLRTEVMYFRKLLESWGIDAEILQIGEYKSAAEPLTRETMSEASRRMLESLLGDMQQRLCARVAENRRVDVETVQKWVDAGPYTAKQAEEKGIVNGLRYEDEMDELLKEDNPRLVELPASKVHRPEGFFKRFFTYRRPQIAYLVADGMIMTGESRHGRARRPVLGADTMIRLLRDVRKRKQVKAVVLRIDSPGGSALASDLMWREIKLTDKVKPVIASLGNVAASGGYYMAVAAQQVLAMPGTLTGSIGIIGGKVNIQRLLARFEVNVDSVSKGRRSGYSSFSQPFSDEEKESVLAQIREFYERLFLPKVAEGRRKSVEDTRTLAEGRVWTGAQAVANGLVDRIGGLSEAVQLAREAAGLPERAKVRVVHYVRKRTLRELVSLSLPGSWLHTRIWAIMPERWNIR